MYVFDLDGTLVDTVEGHISAWVEALRIMGVAARREDVAPLMGLPAPEIARILMPSRAAELAALKNKIFLERYIEQVKAYEDAAVLAHLPRPIAVVTSSSGYVARRILEAAGLSQYIDFVLGGDEVARGKPAPDPLYVVSKRFGVDVRHMVVVGDSDFDMEMAEAAGALGICIARRTRCRKGRKHINSLYELLNL